MKPETKRMRFFSCWEEEGQIIEIMIIAGCSKEFCVFLSWIAFIKFQLKLIKYTIYGWNMCSEENYVQVVFDNCWRAIKILYSGTLKLDWYFMPTNTVMLRITVHEIKSTTHTFQTEDIFEFIHSSYLVSFFETRIKFNEWIHMMFNIRSWSFNMYVEAKLENLFYIMLFK